MNNNNLPQPFGEYTPPPPPTINAQQLPKTNTQGFGRLPSVPSIGMLPPPPPPQDRGFWFTPMVSKEAVAGAPDWIRPVAEFATELTTPFDVGLTAGTALLGGPAAFALRGGVQGALGARKVNLARRGLAAMVDPVGGGRAALPARVLGETGLTAAGHYAYKKGEEKGGVAGGIVAAFAGGAVGGVAGLGVAKGMGKALQAAPVTRSWFENPMTKAKQSYDVNDPTQFRETETPVYTENLNDLKPSLHNIEAEITQGLIKHTKNELGDSWIGRSIDRLPTGVQEFMHSFGRVFNPINHVRKLEHAASIGIFRGEELVRRNTARLMDFVRVNEMPVLFGTTEKRLDITDPESIKNFSFIRDGELLDKLRRTAPENRRGIDPEQISVAQILEESPNPMKNQFGRWGSFLNEDQKAMLKRIQQVNEYTRDEMARFWDPEEVDPTRRRPKKRRDDREVLDLLTYTKEELEELAQDAGLRGTKEGDPLYEFKNNVIGYANRKFVVKLNPDNVTGDIAIIGKDGTAWQVGQRTGSESQRKLTRINLANLEGYRYASLDDALKMSTQSRLGRAMTQSHSKWLIKEVKAGNLDEFISVASKKARVYEILLRDKGLKEKLNLTDKEIKDIVDKYNNGDFSVQPAVLANIQEAESVLKNIDTILAKMKTGTAEENFKLLTLKNKIESTDRTINDLEKKLFEGRMTGEEDVLLGRLLDEKKSLQEEYNNLEKLGGGLSPEDVQLLRQIQKIVGTTGVDISDIYHDKTGEQVVKNLRETFLENVVDYTKEELEKFAQEAELMVDDVILEIFPEFKPTYQGSDRPQVDINGNIIPVDTINDTMEFAVVLAWARRIMGFATVDGYLAENIQQNIGMSKWGYEYLVEGSLDVKPTKKQLTERLRILIKDYKTNLNNEIDKEILELQTRRDELRAEYIRYFEEVYGEPPFIEGPELFVEEYVYQTFGRELNEIFGRIQHLYDLKAVYETSGSPKNLDFDNQDFIKGMSYGVNGFLDEDKFGKRLPQVMDSIFQIQKERARLYPNLVKPEDSIGEYLKVLRAEINKNNNELAEIQTRIKNSANDMPMEGVLSREQLTELLRRESELQALVNPQLDEFEKVGILLQDLGLTENDPFSSIMLPTDMDEIKYMENLIGESWFRTFNSNYDVKNMELFLEKQKNIYTNNLTKYEKIVADAAEQDVIHGNEVVFKSPAELENWIFKVKDDAPAGTFDKLKAFRNSFQSTIERSEVKGMIKWWSQANALQRMVALGFDASIFNIHLLPVLFNHPEVNAQGARGFVKVFFQTMKDKQAGDIFIQNYRNKKENVDILNKYFNQGFLTSDSNEVFEIVKNTGLGEAFRANRVTGNLGASFENAFNHTLDIAGFELLKGLDYLVDTTADAATQASQRKVIVDYVNSMRGLFSSGMQGINPNQSIWESILLLAPRYRRAVAALFVQAFQGDPLRRYLAQKALINTATGLALTTVLLQIGASAIGEDEPEELQVKLDRMLDPSKSDFLLFDMNGQKVGAGSKIVSDARILSKALNFFYKAGTQEDMEEWESFISLSEDNPGLRWIRSQMAYTPSTAWDFFTGADYMGDPTFRKGESDIDTITNFVSPFTELVTPLWMSSISFDNSHGNLDYGDKIIGSATRGLSEFTGLRAYPQGAAAILREASFDIMNAPYDNLEPFQKDILRHSLMDQLTPIQEEQVKRGKNDFAIYFNDVDRINQSFQKELIDMTALYPNTPEGNRNMYDRYRQLKSYRRGQLYEIGYDVEFDEPEPSDVASKNTLNKYYKMFDSVRIAGTQLIDWDQWEIEYEKLMNSLSIDQQLVIARNTSRLPIPYQFLERIKYLGEAKEYKRIMRAQQLREDYFIAQDRKDLASKSRDIYLMLED